MVTFTFAVVGVSVSLEAAHNPDQFSSSRKDRRNPPTPMPLCDIRECSGNGSSKMSFWPVQHSSCAGEDTGQDFRQKFLHIYNWSCPNYKYYHTCAVQDPMQPTCNSYSPQPACPQGNCIPIYNGGNG